MTAIYDLLRREDPEAKALRHAAHVYHTTPAEARNAAEERLYMAAMKYAMCVVRPSIVEGNDQ
jgi:hypothetical protein